MKILAITDIHGAYSVAEKIIVKEKADVVILGGDLTNVGSLGEVKEAISTFQTLCKKLLCIAGNLDLPEHDEWYASSGLSINGRGVVIDGVGFHGVSAAPYSPMHTVYEISEEEIGSRVKKGYEMISNCGRRVFVPHAPPYGTRVDLIHAGYHVGSTAVRDYIDAQKPEAVICGHIHEARGQDTIEKTKVVNCGFGHNGYYATVTIGREIEITNKQLAL